MDDYEEIVKMLQSIKGNSKALAYIKDFLKAFIGRYC